MTDMGEIFIGGTAHDRFRENADEPFRGRRGRTRGGASPVKCRCGRRFRTKKAMSNHMRDKHANTGATTEGNEN